MYRYYQYSQNKSTDIVTGRHKVARLISEGSEGRFYLSNISILQIRNRLALQKDQPAREMPTEHTRHKNIKISRQTE